MRRHNEESGSRSLVKLLIYGLTAIFPVFFLASCDSGPGSPNILLICVDTLRPDRLGHNGYVRPTSPNIDQLASEGLVFTHAYSQSGWTLPSMATLMTGQYPRDHHAVDFHYAMDPQLPTLASILSHRGYDTRAFVSHVLLTPHYGFDKGFQQFDYSVLEQGDPHEVSTSRELTELALASLEDVQEPYFAWIHYFDPHFDYLPHEKWADFGDSDSDRYDQEIAYTDHYIGQLLSRLGERGLLENTAIVFTADHGEEFGDHGGIYHYTCYDEVLRVPLIIKAPGVVPARNPTYVDQVDLFLTMLNLGGGSTLGDFPGHDLLASDLAPHPIFIERDRPPGYRQRSLVLDDTKLFRIEPSDTTLIPPESRATYAEVTNVLPGTYQFDLTRDPAELENLYTSENDLGNQMLARLVSHFTGHDIPVETIAVDEDLRAKLKALGYIH